MGGRLFGGTGRQRDKYYDIVPDSEEMAIWAQNAADQFTDPRLSALNSQDAMERYQRQVAKTSTPEIRIPQEEDKVLEGRKKAHMLINRLVHGGPRGNSDLAYKPEITQSNVSTYTYAVPSTDPIIASRVDNGKGGQYLSDSNGNTVYRERLPNRQTNAELSTRMFNVQNRIAKYASAINRVENTSQIVDFVPQRKDKTWHDRALDEIRHRLMPRVTLEDNGDGYNREKNKCRDTNKVAFKYRHKEYDTNVNLQEVLSNNTRTRPEIGPTDGDGTPIGNLVAELAKDGKAYSYLDNDIYLTTLNERIHNNPNRNKHSKHQTLAELPNYEDEDGFHQDKRSINVDGSIQGSPLEGLDPVRKSLLAAEIIDEIKRTESKLKKQLRARRKEIKNNSVMGEDGFNVDEDAASGVTDQRHVDVKSDDTDRKILTMQIPVLQSFNNDITYEGKNTKPSKKNKHKQFRGMNTRDDPMALADDSLLSSERMYDASSGRIMRDKAESAQGIRSLIKDLISAEELTKSNSDKNPNRRRVYKDGKIVKHGVNHSTLFDRPNHDSELGNRLDIKKSRNVARPFVPTGVIIDPQLEFDGAAKKQHPKRVKPNPVRDIRV